MDETKIQNNFRYVHCWPKHFSSDKSAGNDDNDSQAGLVGVLRVSMCWCEVEEWAWPTLVS